MTTEFVKPAFPKASFIVTVDISNDLSFNEFVKQLRQQGFEKAVKEQKARDAKIKEMVAAKRNEKVKQELSRESDCFDSDFRAGLEWVLVLLGG